MRALRPSHFLFLLASLCWVSLGTAGAETDGSAPYIMVTSEGAETDSLPLKSSKAKVNIAGVMAHVTITQIYENRGDRALEAVYVFPGSTQAAVFGMTMKVGDRVTQAKIKKREAARKLYESAKAEGKTASLLEQHRPNVFQMNVVNIQPQDRVEIVLQYTELMKPKEGVYEFVYPAVVGPRYAGEQSSGETWHENNYGQKGAGTPYQYGISFRIGTGVPLRGLASPSHTIHPTFDGKNSARFALSEKRDGDRDFVLRYRLRGGAIETGLLRFEDKDENFFLLMLQPPKSPTNDAMPPREYVFIVDVSGSMAGFPLTVSKRLINGILTGLRPQDRFNIMFFAGSSYQLSPKSVPATGVNIKRALRVLDQQRGGGGTNLVAALQTALEMPSTDSTSRTFVAVTDGFISADDAAFSMVRKNLDRANFFAFGIGSSVNRNLIEGLARAGMGEPFVALNEEDAVKQAAKFHKLIESPMLTRVKAKFEGLAAYDVIPKNIPDLFSERPLIIYGKYRGSAKGKIEVSGMSGQGAFSQSVAVDQAPAQAANEGLRYLWARRRIAELSDRIAVGAPGELEAEVASLGLRYNLLTKYTSFLAVDSVGRANGAPTLVHQPLPPPSESPVRSYSEGVSVDEYGDDDYDYSDYDVERSLVLVKRSVIGESPTIRSAFATQSIAFDQGFQIASGSRIALPFVTRIGLTKGTELRVGSTLFQRSSGESSPPDLQLGGKLELPSPRSLKLALMAEFDTSFDSAEARQFESRALLLADSKIIGLNMRLNLGVGHLNLRNSSENLFGFAYGVEASWYSRFNQLLRLKPYLAVQGLTIEGSSESQLGLGVLLQFGKQWGLGTEAQIGLTDQTESLAHTLFVRYRL